MRVGTRLNATYKVTIRIPPEEGEKEEIKTIECPDDVYILDAAEVTSGIDSMCDGWAGCRAGPAVLLQSWILFELCWKIRGASCFAFLGY